ncbi:GDP-fucose transporter 1 [Thelohanellus kitauei]|uniref:GDP-fucose transporter 1 n=1 Tax=Thelohanellus kitauei TaxID=669202 RepID=A0A0C2JWM0_THEKT|nr:GDP-fucose transporter 1 [Thelohanellus kitauei]
MMVPVSFYNVARALTTIFNLVFTRFILKKSVSVGSCLCCGVVVLGYIFGFLDAETTNLSPLTVLVGVLSSVFVSLFSIYTQSALTIVDRNSWMLQNMTNINAVILMLPLLPLTGEISIIINQFRDLFTWSLVLYLLASGILGFLIGIATNLQIKYTSALTHNISGTAKACFQTVLAVMINREWNHSFLWWTGSFLVLLGSGLYSYVRSQEMAKYHNQNSLNEPDV